VTNVIAKADAVITVTPYSLTYDGLAQTATGSARGVLNESLAGLNLSGTTHTNAGTYSDTWTFTDATGNYKNASGAVTNVIAKATATIEFSDLIKPFNGTAQQPTAWLKRTAAPYPQTPYPQANVSFTFTPAPTQPATCPSAVGVYTVIARITDPNYTAEPADALFVIYDASAGFVTGGGGQAADEGRQLDQAEAEPAEGGHRQQQRGDRPERRSGGRADDVRVGERVAQQGLKDRPGARQAGTDHHPGQHPRQTQLPHDRLGRRRPGDRPDARQPVDHDGRDVADADATRACQHGRRCGDHDQHRPETERQRRPTR
jgi:hypothetical protein